METNMVSKKIKISLQNQYNKAEFYHELKIHPLESKRVLIIYPGYNGSIDGYDEKYTRIAKNLIEANICAVVRSGNEEVPFFEFPYSSVMILRRVIDFVISNGHEITRRSEKLEIYLMGVSMGGSAAISVQASFPNIKKILLIAPSAIGNDKNREELGSYDQHLHIAVGEKDDVTGTDIAQDYYKLAANAKRSITVYPDIDHQFTGDTGWELFQEIPMQFFGDK